MRLLIFLLLCVILGLTTAWIWLSWWLALAITAAVLGGIALLVRRVARGVLPERPLLYMFQHVALREAAFENHPELLQELDGKKSVLPFLHFRSRASLLCQRAKLLPPDYDIDDDVFNAEIEMFASVASHPHRRNGYTAYLITMPEPKSPPEAHFVAIVYRDGEPHEYMQPSPSTRYFTLEKTFGSVRTAMCEWRWDGSRENYGDGPPPDLGAFAEAVFARVVGEPSGRAEPV